MGRIILRFGVVIILTKLWPFVNFMHFSTSLNHSIKGPDF